MKFSDEKPLIYLITKGAATVENFRSQSVEILKIIESAVRANVALVQIREKLLPAKLVFDLASRAAEITKNSNTKLLVNDRADIALAAGADGVHLTSRSMPPEIIRRAFPADFVVGASAHSLEELEKARRAGADFATFGPIFETPSKARYGAAQGVAKLRAVAAQTAEEFPVIALGGIDESNFREVLASGAAGIAAIRFLNDAENLQTLTEKFRK